MTTSKIILVILSFIINGFAYADDGHQLAQHMITGATMQVPTQQSADASALHIDGHTRAAALLTQAFRTSATTGISSPPRRPKDDPHERARHLIVGL